MFIRQTGSHAIFKKNKAKMVVVPIHNRDILTGTLNSIMKDADLL